MAELNPSAPAEPAEPAEDNSRTVDLEVFDVFRPHVAVLIILACIARLAARIALVAGSPLPATLSVQVPLPGPRVTSEEVRAPAVPPMSQPERTLDVSAASSVHLEIVGLCLYLVVALCTAAPPARRVLDKQPVLSLLAGVMVCAGLVLATYLGLWASSDIQSILETPDERGYVCKWQQASTFAFYDKCPRDPGWSGSRDTTGCLHADAEVPLEPGALSSEADARGHCVCKRVRLWPTRDQLRGSSAFYTTDVGQGLCPAGSARDDNITMCSDFSCGSKAEQGCTCQATASGAQTRCWAMDVFVIPSECGEAEALRSLSETGWLMAAASWWLLTAFTGLVLMAMLRVEWPKHPVASLRHVLTVPMTFVALCNALIGMVVLAVAVGPALWLVSVTAAHSCARRCCSDHQRKTLVRVGPCGFAWYDPKKWVPPGEELELGGRR